MKITFPLLLCSLFTLVLTTCKSDDDTTAAQFDRTVFLDNYANNIIKPSFAELVSQVEGLKANVSTFTNQPTLDNLQLIQDSWKASYSQWMRTNSFNFGPAGSEGLTRPLMEEIGLFPVLTVIIDGKINANNFELDDAQRASRGFLAIEYLIFGNGNNEETLAAFDTNRLLYLDAITGQLMERITTVNDQWLAGYTAEFISNDGTSVSSSTTQMYNEWLRSFESIKTMKLSMPLGLIAGQSAPEPETAEAFYSQESLTYTKQHFNAIVDLWYGTTNSGVDSTGWEDYLLSVEGGANLVELTKDQIAAVNIAFDNLPTDKTFTEMVTEENTQLIALQQELQNLVRFFKSDLSSLLGLAITFSSSDGD